MDPAFNFDDAFSDGDEDTVGLEFSPDSIREDLARIHTTWENAEDLPDQSVSTIDINANDHFSSISLSDDRDDDGNSTHYSDALESPYPAVMIDASVSPTVHVSPSFLPHGDASPPPPSQSPPPSPIAFALTESTDEVQTVEVRTPSLQLGSRSVPSSPINISHVHPTSPSTSSLSISKPLGHRPTRSVGPSALEKVMSKTRPSFLPPKSRKEDQKHMADWESMMKLSRAAAEKRRKALQERRLARDKKIEDSIHLWERDILPDWRAVTRNPALRRLWWKGIPSKLRAQMWEAAVGNPLSLNKDSYRTCLARAKRALSAGSFPASALALLDADIASTLPALHIFHPVTGPLHSDLRDMLLAWVVSRSDEGLGYTSGAARVAAMLVLNMPVERGFVVMRNLLERHCLRSFYGGAGGMDDVAAYYRIFDTLLADGMPKIYFNFKQHQISPASYLPHWLIPLFLDHLPFEACARVWDVLLLEGDAFLFRAALGILGVLESRLFFPERRELEELLWGENKAALDVARREGWALDGGKYEIYGVDEETLWERIEGMEDWWKESTWTRLTQRELPDL